MKAIVRIVLGLHSTKFIQAPFLMSVDFLDALVTKGIVHICIEWCRPLTFDKQPPDLLSSGNSNLVKSRISIDENCRSAFIMSVNLKSFFQFLYRDLFPRARTHKCRTLCLSGYAVLSAGTFTTPLAAYPSARNSEFSIPGTFVAVLKTSNAALVAVTLYFLALTVKRGLLLPSFWQGNWSIPCSVSPESWVKSAGTIVEATGANAANSLVYRDASFMVPSKITSI